MSDEKAAKLNVWKNKAIKTDPLAFSGKAGASR
jgi:hypothetical protein